MNKRQLHHMWTKVRWLKPRYFLILALLSGTVCVLALRANNEHMIKLRAVVYSADQKDSNIQGALEALQAYVTAHMNTNLSAGPNAVYPPIQLKFTYNRLVTAESDTATQNNTQLYTDAQAYCQQQDPTDFSGHNRVPCIEQYVETHDAQLPTIPEALYEFSFISPRWSPDLAGWSLVITVFSGLLFIGTFTLSKLIRK